MEGTKPETAQARAAFYARIDEENLTPLWEVLSALVPPTPTTPCVPAMWRYQDFRPYLMEAGRLITASPA
jgi:gentisate 1,2-dioxygenase